MNRSRSIDHKMMKQELLSFLKKKLIAPIAGYGKHGQRRTCKSEQIEQKQQRTT